MNRREYIKNTCLGIGLAISATSVSELLISCQKEAKLNWKPVFLNNTQANTMAEIAETICPKTATLGAKELGVPQFIDKMLKGVFTEPDQKAFTEGIAALDAQCQIAYGKPFVDCTRIQKETLLTKLDTESPKFPANMWGVVLTKKTEPITFFRKMKSLTLMAYFTSEKIGKEVLVYDPVPGKYIACMPQKGQNSWTE